MVVTTEKEVAEETVVGKISAEKAVAVAVAKWDSAAAIEKTTEEGRAAATVEMALVDFGLEQYEVHVDENLKKEYFHSRKEINIICGGNIQLRLWLSIFLLPRISW